MSKQLNISNFFKSNTRTTDDSTSLAPPQNDLSQPLQIVPVVLDESDITVDVELDNSSTSKKFKSNDYKTLTDAEAQPFSKNDIGLFVGKDGISAAEIHDALTNSWIPSDNYKFPQVLIHNKKRSVCQHSWLSRYPWLSYSHVSHGVLCRYCVLFKRKWSSTDRTKTPLGQLVSKSLASLHNAHEELQAHEKSSYHIFSKEQAENFIINYSIPEKAIDHTLDKKDQEQVATNRKILASIIKCVLFLGKQNLPFRGDNDDGIEFEPKQSLGNFKELILFRIDSGDVTLEQHVKNCSKNAMYMSAEIQNELIKICGGMIREKVIRSCIDEKKFYSVIVDATADISGTEQLSLSIRYTCCDNNRIQIKEEFIGFAPIIDSSAKGISGKIIEYLRSIGLDLTYLRGQGYDGCTVMSGHLGGVQKLICDTAPSALYVHCASHSLDLAICDACDDKIIKLFFGTLKAIIKFISGSPKRQNLLKKAVEATICNTKRKKLAKLVEHRWVEKATSVLVFKQLFTSVMIALEYLIESADAETSANARAYFKCIKDADFIIYLFVVSRVFAILKPYTEMLQSKNYDLAQCYNNIEEAALYLAELKYDPTKFNELETELEQFAGDNDIMLTLPRTNKYTNISAYLKNIYEKFIETTLTELGNRFSKHQTILVNISNLLPSYVVDKEFNDVKQAFDFYKDDIPSNDMNVLMAEFEMWQYKWKKISIAERPSNVVDSLNVLLSIRSFYPNLFCLFELFAVLPVTVSTAERSFSAMKRIKTSLRNSIGDERLSNLALIHIHHDIASKLDVEDVIKVFSKDNRRIKLQTNKQN